MSSTPPASRRARVNSITKHFASLPDPRVARTRVHLLTDLITIAILAVIAGAEGWDDIETYAEAREPMLREFLDLPGGAPSDDTFQRLFVRLNPKAFVACFTAWMSSLIGSCEGKLVALDGKTLRRSFDRARGKGPLHLVHAWVAENRVLLGQYATEEKSNEITAIPELLDLLDLRGAVVTLDAMGCQKKIVAKIIEKEADYAITLKGNQSKLHTDVADYMDAAIADRGVRTYETREENHGRIEVRRVSVSSDVDWLEGIEEWVGLRTGAVRFEGRWSSNGIDLIG